MLVTPVPHLRHALRHPLRQGCATPARVRNPCHPCTTPAPPLRHLCATPAPPLRLTLSLKLRHSRRFGAPPLCLCTSTRRSHPRGFGTKTPMSPRQKQKPVVGCTKKAHRRKYCCPCTASLSYADENLNEWMKVAANSPAPFRIGIKRPPAPRKKRPAIEESRGGGFGCEANTIASAIARACYWHGVGGFVFKSSSSRKDDTARCCCRS